MLRHIISMLTIIFILTTAAPAIAEDAYYAGAVYAMTNDANSNEILVFDRSADGFLSFGGAFATNGMGKTTEVNDALGAQNPLILSPHHPWLFAVNAGSNEISVFKVKTSGLALVQVVPSGGEFPVSLTIHGDLLYVLNAGGEGNITGFTIDPGGHLSPLAGSTRSLNAGGTNPPFFLESPAQVGFNPLGNMLVVTVKGIHPVHQIHVFGVDRNGLPSVRPVTTTSNTTLSFGFVFAGLNHLLVAEPFGNSLGPDGQGNDIPPPVPMEGAVTSYKIKHDGELVPISTSVLNKQTATCWIAVTTDRRFAYTTNNVSNSISSYKVDPRGRLVLINEIAAVTGTAPVDLAITSDSSYLYNVNTADGTLGMYRINRVDGSLIRLGTIDGLLANGTAAGIAAR
jgi:6-phosphogluconolactonase